MEQYSTMQKLTLAGMVVGCLMVTVGAGTPYWINSDPEGFGEIIDTVAKLVRGHLGLFMVCIETMVKSECSGINNDSGWFHTSRLGASACVLLSIVCAGISCCLSCCKCCRRFIMLGIISFLAAGSGAYCVIVFSENTETFTGSFAGFQLTSFGWSYYLFIGGVVILGLMSFTACFSSPNNPIRGFILRQPVANQVVVATSTTHVAGHHPYLPLGQAGSQISTNATVVTTNGY